MDVGYEYSVCEAFIHLSVYLTQQLIHVCVSLYFGCVIRK